MNGPGLVEGVQLANHPGPASSVMGMRDTLAGRTSIRRDNQAVSPFGDAHTPHTVPGARGWKQNLKRGCCNTGKKSDRST